MVGNHSREEQEPEALLRGVRRAESRVFMEIGSHVLMEPRPP